VLRIREGERQAIMNPGSFRGHADHDVVVGRHAPPSGDRVLVFMDYFEECYRMDRMGKAGRII
jgi:hypothetical protein